MIDLPFRHVWAVDFEYIADPGERPDVVCVVVREVRTGQLLRFWRDEMPSGPPFSVGADTLFVAYAAAAEMGCFLQLGWPMPVRVLDLHFEYLHKINGRRAGLKDGLLWALAAHGLRGITAEQKDAGRALVLRGGPWSADEREEVLTYCQTDVDCLAPLLERMLPAIRAKPKGLGQALLRGRYAVAVARMEHLGVPVDKPLLDRFRASWAGIKLGLVAEVDRDFGIYEGATFKTARFTDWLKRQNIPWPRTEGGALALDRDTFHEMGRVDPRVAALGDLRHAMGNLRLESLSVGGDGRNRTSLMPFRARTGRNQPSNAKFIFGPGKWLRGLIRPEPGKVVAYIDWSAQEVAIAAALSSDQAMIDDVLSGDPYLALAKMAGLAPEDATKQSHGDVRDQCKACVLGANYGMGHRALALRIGANKELARHLLKTMARRYPVYTKWSEAIVDAGYMSGQLSTVFGWSTHVLPHDRPTTLLNYPMQSNGSEMLRLACCLATERGVRVTAPIHDAVLIEADTATEEQEIAACRDAMAEASRGVLGGMEIKTDVKVVRWPDRYADERGALMWRRVTGLLEEVERSEGRSVGGGLEGGREGSCIYIIKKEELGESVPYLPVSNLPTLEPSSLIDMAGS